MRKHLILSALAVLSVSFGAMELTSCQTATKLSEDIAGDWSGTPVRFSKKTDINGTFTPEFRFERQGNSKGGDLTVSSAVTVMMPVNAPIDSLGTTAVSATAAGIATVRGTWVAVDDDEVKLHYDFSTLVVNMDPDVQFELANVWTSNDVPSERTVSEAVKKTFVKQMTDGMTYSLEHLDELDDIDIHDKIMRCEFLKQKHTLSRVFE